MKAIEMEKNFSMDLSWIEVWLHQQRAAVARNNCRKLSEQIQKLGERFVRNLNIRDRSQEKADMLSKKLIEEAGKVKKLRPGAHGGASSEQREAMKVAAIERAVMLAAEGKLEEAKKVMSGY